jgi:two-component system CheB/CheR fusion protein
MRLLIVDDNRKDSDLICVHLRREFPECEFVQICQAADLEYALAGPDFDIAVTEYQLNGSDGLQLLGRLRERWPDIPVVMFTRSGNEEVAVAVMKAGLSDYVLKDHPARLLDAVRRGLEHARQHRERCRWEAAVCRQTEELRIMDRRKDEFLATLAHELRNPLAPIMNAVQTMQLCAGHSATVEQALAVADHQVHHLARLVDDLLEISRITRGKIQLHKVPVNLAFLVQRAVEGVRPLLDARGHDFAVGLPLEPVLLDADPTRLEQVITNLLTNAAKYTERGGQISVIVEYNHGAAVVRVRDSGVGIEPEMMPHIFDMFMQAEQTRDRSQGGLGIGLTLTRRLVELHGGTIEARSEGKGCGSEFIVSLPGVVAPSRWSVSATASTWGDVAAPMRVLVVDDNVEAASSLAGLLRLWYHEVQVVHDGPGALVAALALRPEVVLCDIGMPGMNGYEIARRLRQLPELQQALLVALTGYGQPDDRDRSLQAGFHLHLVKPIDADVLHAILGQVPVSG